MKNKSNEEKKLFKAKNDISDTTNFMSINFPKFSMTKLSNSIINSKLNNSSNQKILPQDNSNINNSNITDSILKLNESANEKMSISKSKIKSSIKSSINKKNKRKITMLPNLPSDKNSKSQQTIFQKIITDLDKVKTKANKTLDVMKKNLRISRKEIVKRRNYQKQSQIVPTNILNFEKNEENKRNDGAEPR